MGSIRGLAVAILALAFTACGGAASASVSPSPTPTGAPADAVVQAFIAQTQAPDRSMHLEYTATVDAAGFVAQLTASYDISGADFIGRTAVSSVMFGDRALVNRSLRLGGVSYRAGQDADGHDQAYGQTDEPLPDQDPFVRLTAADVAYMRAETTADGRAVHRLRLTDPVGAFARSMGATGLEAMTDLDVSTSSFEVLVDDGGRPLSADLAIEGTLSGETPGQLKVAFAYTFSGWGADIDIAMPSDVVTPPPATPVGAVFIGYNRYDEAVIFRDSQGRELTVLACGDASTDAFDVNSFTVVFASDGGYVAEFHNESPQYGTYRWALVAPSGASEASGSAFPSDLEPCAARP